MTKNVTNMVFGSDVKKIAKIVSKVMPALDFVIWDLAPFMPNLHNWRRNIVFIECDGVAVDSLSDYLSVKYPNFDVYAGVKKPVLKFCRGKKSTSIVVVARSGKTRREVTGRYPSLEKCLVDLLYYAINDVLPISLRDVLDLWEYYLTETDLVKFNELYRYSLRRYLGWFVSIFAYALSKRAKLKADGRHCKAGLKNLELIRMVGELE